MSPPNQSESPVGPSCHYSNQVCIGGFEPSIMDMFRTNSPHGLTLTTAYIYGALRDEEGGIYNYMRNIGVEALPVVYLYYKAPDAQPVIHPEEGNLFRGMAVNRLRGEEIRIHSWRAMPGPGFSTTVRTDSFQLVEEGTIELSGKRLGLGMNVYFPQGGQDIYYSSVFYETEGVVFGRKVTGGMGWDQVYAPPGEIWQGMRFLQGVQQAWVSGICVYEDETEMYHAVSGKGDWGWLFASSGKGITAISRSVKAEVELDPDSYPSRVLFRTDSRDWEWTGNPDHHLNPEAQNLPLRWVEGPIRRVGEKRKQLFGSGWMEVYPGHL
jgi:hypothetical protein